MVMDDKLLKNKPVNNININVLDWMGTNKARIFMLKLRSHIVGAHIP